MVPAASFDLAIRGTDIQYSPLGLPAAMGGDVYLGQANATAHAPIGRYQETLTPILMDINGDQVPDFVGTQGVATFTFFMGAPQYSVGSITTADTSYIQGVTAAGQLLVGSQGSIIASTSVFRGLSGGFVSQSTVGMAPTFEMQTNVHFTVNRPVAPVFTVLSMTADVVSSSPNLNSHLNSNNANANVLSQESRGSGGAVSGGDDCRHGDGQRHDSKSSAASRRESTHDSIFGDDVDWRPNHSAKDLLLV